jgi:hypothetical protein
MRPPSPWRKDDSVATGYVLPHPGWSKAFCLPDQFHHGRRLTVADLEGQPAALAKIGRSLFDDSPVIAETVRTAI